MRFAPGSENVMQNLLSRGLNPSLYPTAFCDVDCAHFMLTDFSGKFTGFHVYRPAGDKKAANCPKTGKYWSYLPKGQTGVLGLESLDNPGPVYLVGGLFKAATLHRLGYAALHVSGNSPKVLKQQMDLLNREYVAIGDLDDEGEQFVRVYGRGFQARDLDELSDQLVHAVLRW
jgi:hypothetical protein